MQIKSINKTTSSKWISLYNVIFNYKGKEGLWTFASRRENPLSKRDVADAVVIIPFVKIDNEYKIILTKEFRIPINGFEYGFPAGLIEKNETATSSAKRELVEETGYKIKEILKVSPFTVSSAGLTDECSTIIICEAEYFDKPNLQDSECIETLILDTNELTNLLNEDIYWSARAWGLVQSLSLTSINDYVSLLKKQN